MSYTVAIVGNAAFTMQKFRGQMISFLAERGATVYCFAPDYSAGSRAAIEALGGTPVDFAHDRTGISLFGAVASVWDLAKKLRHRKVDLVFCYFLKPVIVANLAARLARVPLVYSMIEGRGMIFSDSASTTLKHGILKFGVTVALGMTLRLSRRVFVLNQEDLKFVESLVGRQDDRVVQLNGIGLDTDYYRPLEEYDKPVRFIFCGRLLKSKGITEFVQAARVMKPLGYDVEFMVIGDVDENADSVSESQMVEWSEQGIIEWLGFQSDTRPFFHRHAVLVLPTYYPEGLPRSIQEAFSMACPVITTDAPGCGEQVDEGVTGFVIESRNSDAIKDKMCYFAQHKGDIVAMGDAARRYAVTHFQSEVINRIIFQDIRPVHQS